MKLFGYNEVAERAATIFMLVSVVAPASNTVLAQVCTAAAATGGAGATARAGGGAVRPG